MSEYIIAAEPPSVEYPTARLRFVTRKDYIMGVDRAGNDVAVGERPKEVLQQLWEIIPEGSQRPRRTEWRDVPTDSE